MSIKKIEGFENLQGLILVPGTGTTLPSDWQLTLEGMIYKREKTSFLS
jgi:hypothetical protein